VAVVFNSVAMAPLHIHMHIHIIGARSAPLKQQPSAKSPGQSRSR
jgi:hypothetical protein